jgi:hypothetical protein
MTPALDPRSQKIIDDVVDYHYPPGRRFGRERGKFASKIMNDLAYTQKYHPDKVEEYLTTISTLRVPINVR